MPSVAGIRPAAVATAGLFAAATLAAGASCGHGPAAGGTEAASGAGGLVTSDGRPVDRSELEALARRLHDVLVSGSPEAIESLAASRAEVEGAVGPPAVDGVMLERRADWQSVGSLARAFAPYGQSLLDGWCARGLRMAGGVEGFIRPTPLIESMLVVGRIGRIRFASWVERIVLLDSGWRLLRISVELPRENHSSIELWDCDIGELGLSSDR